MRSNKSPVQQGDQKLDQQIKPIAFKLTSHIHIKDVGID